MLQFRRQTTDLDITSINELRRHVGIRIMASLIIVGVTYGIFSFATGFSLTTSPTVFPLVLAVVGAFATVLLRRKQFVTPVLYVPGVLFLVAMFVIRGELVFTALTFSILVYTAVMSDWRFFGAISIVILLWTIYIQFSSSYPHLLFTIVALAGSGIVSYVAYRFEKTMTSASRTNQLLQASSHITQVINQELELQQLLDNTVNSIRDEFAFYHVQVFLVDEAHVYANLIASTGEAGRQLLIRNHRLPIGSQSVIGRVTQVGEPIVTQKASTDTIHAQNELLPDTQAELALPIIDSGNIIGALDVQSVNADTFQSTDIQALQIIANQLGVAIRNARLFEEAQKTIRENKRLVFEYETNLREVDRLNRTLTKQSWDNYLTNTYVDGVTLSKERFIPKAEWSEVMRTATARQQTHITTANDTHIIAVPIILRGQILGAIEVEVDAKRSTTDSADLIQAVSQRLAISLESARLFEETQEATLQEQQINEIVSSYETAVTIDELLQVTLEKLQQSLGAEKGTIRLGTLDTTDTSPQPYNGNGGSSS